jgi:hypothetical protein
MAETAWLLEWSGRENDRVCLWWHPGPGWVRDANKAIRFSRRIDAEDYAKAHRMPHYMVTEHLFCCVGGMEE